MSRLLALFTVLALTALGFATAVALTSRTESFGEVATIWAIGLAASGLVFAVHGVTIEVMDHRDFRSTRTGRKIWLMVGMLFLSHLVQIQLYGLILYLTAKLGLGHLTGDLTGAVTAAGAPAEVGAGLGTDMRTAIETDTGTGLGAGIDTTAGVGADITASIGTFPDYLYYSFAAYTSLGLGDIAPTGPLRLLTGLETLTGLLCIGWSTAYIFNALKGRGRGKRLQPPTKTKQFHNR